MLVLGVLLAVAFVAAWGAWVALARWPRLDPGAPGGAVKTAGEEIERDIRAGFLRRRLEPGTVTGLALTVAIAVVVLGGGGAPLPPVTPPPEASPPPADPRGAHPGR